MKNKSGFTLLEIIIVIIIVGVLASLALPRLFSTVEFSRATEALNSINVIRQSVLRCGMMDNKITSCTTFTQIDVADPANEAGTHFSPYTISVTTGTPPYVYSITAARNSLDGGTPGNKVVLTVNASGFTRTGTTAFQAIK